MKNLKILFGSLVVILSMVFIYSCAKQEQNIVGKTDLLENRVVGESCLKQNQPPTTGSCAPGVFTTLVTLPMYPGCTFHVTLDYFQCTTLGIGDQAFHLGEFKIFDHDCAQYNLDAQNPNATWDLNVNTQVWAAITTQFLNTTIPSTVNSFSLEYHVNKCSKTCYVESKPNKEGMTAILPVTVHCGSDCCKRETGYIRTSNGWAVTYQNVTSVPGQCIPTNLPCPPRTISSTQCNEVGCTALTLF